MGIGQIGAAGMQASFAKIAGAAGVIASGADINDQIEPMTTMVSAPPIYAANAEVIKAADEMVGTLLDTLA